MTTTSFENDEDGDDPFVAFAELGVDYASTGFQSVPQVEGGANARTGSQYLHFASDTERGVILTPPSDGLSHRIDYYLKHISSVPPAYLEYTIESTTTVVSVPGSYALRSILVPKNESVEMIGADVVLDDMEMTAINIGRLAKTLDDCTLAASTDLQPGGTVAATLDPVSLTATGFFLRSGSLAATLDDVSLDATGDLPISGTLSTTLDTLSLAATAFPPLSGSLVATLGDLTLAGVGTEANTASLATTFNNITLIARGGVPVVSGFPINAGTNDWFASIVR